MSDDDTRNVTLCVIIAAIMTISVMANHSKILNTLSANRNMRWPDRSDGAATTWTISKKIHSRHLSSFMSVYRIGSRD